MAESPTHVADEEKLQFFLPITMMNCFTLPTSHGGPLPGCHEQIEVALSLPVNARGADAMGRFLCPSACKDNLLNAVVKEKLDRASLFESALIRFVLTSFTRKNDDEVGEGESHFVSVCSGTRSNLVSKTLDVVTIRDAVTKWFKKQWPPDLDGDIKKAFKYLLEDVMGKEEALKDCKDKEVLTKFIEDHEWGNASVPNSSAPLQEQRKFIQENIAFQLKIVGSAVDGQHRTLAFKICFEGRTHELMDGDLSKSIEKYSEEPKHMEVEIPVVFHIPASRVTEEVCSEYRDFSSHVQNLNDHCTAHGILMYLRLIMDATHTSFGCHWLLSGIDLIISSLEKTGRVYSICRSQLDDLNENDSPDDLTKCTLSIEVKALEQNPNKNNPITQLFMKFACITKDHLGEDIGTRSDLFQQYLRIIWRTGLISKTVHRAGLPINGLLTAFLHAWTMAIMSCIYKALKGKSDELPRDLHLFKNPDNQSWHNHSFYDFCTLVRRRTKTHGELLYPIPILVSSSARLPERFLKCFDVGSLVPENNEDFYEVGSLRHKATTDNMVDLVHAVLMAFLSQDSFSNTSKFVTTKGLETSQVSGSNLRSEQKWLRFFIHTIVCSVSMSTKFYTTHMGFFKPESECKRIASIGIVRASYKETIPQLYLFPQALEHAGRLLHRFGLNPDPKSLITEEIHFERKAKGVMDTIVSQISADTSISNEAAKGVTQELLKFLRVLFQKDEKIDALSLIISSFLFDHLQHIVPSELEIQRDRKVFAGKVVLHSIYQSLAEMVVKGSKTPHQRHEDAVNQLVLTMKEVYLGPKKKLSDAAAITYLTVGKESTRSFKLNTDEFITDVLRPPNQSWEGDDHHLKKSPYMILSLLRSHPDHPLTTNLIDEWWVSVGESENSGTQNSLGDFLIRLCLQYIASSALAKLSSINKAEKTAIAKGAATLLKEKYSIDLDAPSGKKQQPSGKKRKAGSKSKEVDENSSSKKTRSAEDTEVDGGGGGLIIENSETFNDEMRAHVDDAVNDVFNNIRAPGPEGGGREENEQPDQQINELSGSIIRSKNGNRSETVQREETSAQEGSDSNAEEAEQDGRDQDVAQKENEQPDQQINELSGGIIRSKNGNRSETVQREETSVQEGSDPNAEEAEQDGSSDQDVVAQTSNKPPINDASVQEGNHPDGEQNDRTRTSSARAPTNLLQQLQSPGASAAPMNEQWHGKQRDNQASESPNGGLVDNVYPNEGDDLTLNPDSSSFLDTDGELDISEVWQSGENLYHTENLWGTCDGGRDRAGSVDLPDVDLGEGADERDMLDFVGIPLDDPHFPPMMVTDMTETDSHARAVQLLYEVLLSQENTSESHSDIREFLTRINQLQFSPFIQYLKNANARDNVTSIQNLIKQLSDQDKCDQEESPLRMNQGTSNACTIISLLLSISVIKKAQSDGFCDPIDGLSELVTFAITQGRKLWLSEKAKSIRGRVHGSIDLENAINFLESDIFKHEFTKEMPHIQEPLKMFDDPEKRNKAFMKFRTESHYAAMCIQHGGHTYAIVKWKDMGYHCIETKEWDGDNNDKESAYIRSYKEIHQVIIHVLLKACKRLRVYLLNNTTAIDSDSPYFYFNYLFIESGKEDLDKIHDELALTRSITSWLG